MAGNEGKHLFALDFDGVVCDSVWESSVSGWKAAASQWPDVFNSPLAQSQYEAVLAGMRAVRPVVETGYENVLHARLLLDGMPPQRILDEWATMLPQAMQDLGVERGPLVELFGRVRDDWMAEDLAGWLDLNRIYPLVAPAVQSAQELHEVYIVTTKQAHFTEALMRDKAGVPVPLERIFSQTVSGKPKTEVLAMLQRRHAGEASDGEEEVGRVAGMHFVEDKFSTLEKVCKDPALSSWQLYLVDWGYNTQQEREAAQQHPRIRLIGADQFVRLMETGSADSQQ